MQNNESKFYEDWFRIADKDLNRAEIMLNARDPSCSGVFVQQAMEKYLKGYLISKGWKLERTHDLGKLIDCAVEFDPSFEKFREQCQKITQYYKFERYPLFLTLNITVEEIEDDIKKTIELKEMILIHIKGEKE